MSHTNQAQFRERISSAYQLLRGVSEEGSQRPFREGGWSRKEILGHLIDSALNNHQRFVRAALDGSYNGPSYEQEGWVAMHGTEPWHGTHCWSIGVGKMNFYARWWSESPKIG